jgi:acetyl-CoA carboxylase biotin carboxyl carrier protein
MASEIRSTMPGIMVEIMVNPGDRFESGDIIAMIEAMKMQIPIESQTAGTVETIALNVGDIVDEDGIILTYT